MNNSPFSFKDIPDKGKTLEKCVDAILQDVENIKHVPEKHQTSEMFTRVVSINPYLIEHVPARFLTVVVFIAAFASENTFFCEFMHILHFLPENFNREEVFLTVVIKRWRIIKIMPTSLKSFEICKTAVSLTFDAIYYIPIDFFTFDFTIYIIKTHHIEISSRHFLERFKILVNLIGEDVLLNLYCFEAVKNDGLFLIHIPKEYQYMDLCLAAVNQNREAITFVKNSIVLQIFKNNYLDLNPKISKKNITECPICLDDVVDYYYDNQDKHDGNCCDIYNGLSKKITNCGHLFHAECLNVWVYNGNKTCPVCRKYIQ